MEDDIKQNDENLPNIDIASIHRLLAVQPKLQHPGREAGERRTGIGQSFANSLAMGKPI
jgi:hypothetical protein